MYFGDKYCSHCGKALEYCKDCGKEIHMCTNGISLPSSILHKCKITNPSYLMRISQLEDEKYCSICGEELPEMFYCESCGAPVYPSHSCVGSPNTINKPLLGFPIYKCSKCRRGY